MARRFPPPQPHSSAEQLVRNLLAQQEYAGLSQELAKRVWAAMIRSPHKEHRDLYQTTAAMIYSYHNTHDVAAHDAMVGRYLESTLTPQVVVLAVEDVVLAGGLDRRGANAITERILQATDATGRWKD